MSRNLLAVTVAALLAAASFNATARGGGGGSPGGMSAGHMSTAGAQNTNGPQAADRDKGLDRAEDRMSAAGASHEKAQQVQKKNKRHRTPAARTDEPR